LGDWSIYLGERLLNAISTGEVPSPGDVSTPAEMQQFVELAESRSRAIMLLLVVTEHDGRMLSDEVIQQLLLLDPQAAEEIAGMAAVLVGRRSWTRVRHLVLFITRRAATSIRLATWITFLRNCITNNLAKEALELFVDAGIAERWAPLYEALRAAADGSRAQLETLAPEMRVAAHSIFDQLHRPDLSQAGDGDRGSISEPRPETRKAARRAASSTEKRERSKPGARRRPAG
jgi:hypothetical protein